MMSEEIGDLLPYIGAETPEKGNGSRYSTGLTPSPVHGKKGVPNYLRSSTGSCHDLCKFGRKHETETKPWSAGRGRRIDRKPLVKIVTTDEVLPDRKNYVKAKGQLSDSSCASKQKMPSSEKRALRSNVSKSKAPSKLKSLATPGRLSDPGRIVTERVSPDIEVSKQVSVKVTERGISGKLAIHSRTKDATTGPTSSSKSPASSCPRSKDRKAAAENTGIFNRIRVRNAAIASTSSVPTKSSTSSALTLVKRKLWKPKTVIGQKNQKMAEAYRIQRIEKQVPEKTLYVIGVESDNEGKSFDVSEISVENELPESEENGIISERPPSPSPSPSVTESLSQQNSSTHEEGKEGMENSCIQYSCQEEEEEEEEEEGEYDDGDHDEEEDREEVGSEYSVGESEAFSDLESNETQNKEEELTSTGDGVRRRPREASVRVHPEGVDGKPVKLKFRRGRVVELQSNDSTPRRLKFRRRKSPVEDEARSRPQRRIPKKREVAANLGEVSDPSSEKYALRRSSVQEKDRQGALFNNVIEETASKLVETRKSKVKALVGAFETVISLQDRKPSAANSG